jgi:hypothetical protein
MGCDSKASQRTDPAFLKLIAHERTAGSTICGLSFLAPDMVTNSIKRAIAKIDQMNAPLGRHLHTCVRTGNFCSYTPDPRTSGGLATLTFPAPPSSSCDRTVTS